MQNKIRNVNKSIPIKTMIVKKFEGYSIRILLNGREQRKGSAISYKEAKSLAAKQEADITSFYLSKMN